MKNFEYAVPETINKALEYLDSSKALLKGGGIDLLDLMKEQLMDPERVVSIRDLEELRFLKEESARQLSHAMNCIVSMALMVGQKQ